MVGDSLLLMSEEYSIADNKQTDFGFRVDAQAEDPLRPDSPCPVRSLRMTLSWVGSPVLTPDMQGSSLSPCLYFPFHFPKFRGP